MSVRKEVDVLVIGAGPSGSITAAMLHKAGLSVQIVEK
ncbi:MAG: FAD-binding protein, partial [Sphingobacteriales bacterium]